MRDAGKPCIDYLSIFLFQCNNLILIFEECSVFSSVYSVCTFATSMPSGYMCYYISPFVFQLMVAIILGWTKMKTTMLLTPYSIATSIAGYVCMHVSYVYAMHLGIFMFSADSIKPDHPTNSQLRPQIHYQMCQGKQN